MYTVCLCNTPNSVHSLNAHCELQCMHPSPCLPVSLAELEEYLLATKCQAVASKDGKQSKTGSGSSWGLPSSMWRSGAGVCVCVSVWSYDEGWSHHVTTVLNPLTTSHSVCPYYASHPFSPAGHVSCWCLRWRYGPFPTHSAHQRALHAFESPLPRKDQAKRQAEKLAHPIPVTPKLYTPYTL